MALASYFSKDLLAINRLVNTNHNLLEDKLNKWNVAIVFDKEAANSSEGKLGLDLLVRLTARFYPFLSIIDLSGNHNNLKQELEDLSKAVNSRIEFISKDTYDLIFVAGRITAPLPDSNKVCYWGSDSWIAKYSPNNQQQLGNSENPFGVGVSVCVAVSNAFRFLFSNALSGYEPDQSLKMSVLKLVEGSTSNFPLAPVNLEDVTLAGVGAIGNGVVWALSNYVDLSGNLTLVDSEAVSLSNLQRYVLFSEKDQEKNKTDLAKSFFNQPKLNVEAITGTWADYTTKRNDWNIKCVGVGIDNELDRIGIQSSLPEKIFNAFTEAESIGITRHSNPASGCLACSYIPLQKSKNRINEIADNCNIPDKFGWVKDYYNLKMTVDEAHPQLPNTSLLNEIAQANQIDINEMTQYHGMLVEEFYSDFVCGGAIIKMGSSVNKAEQVDAPLAFQSALAGILLAAEIIKEHMPKKLKIESRTDVYHLSPIKKGLNPYHRIVPKDSTGRCICSDELFLNRYKEKWA